MKPQLTIRAGWTIELEIVDGLDLAGDTSSPGAPPTIDNTLAGSMLVSNTIVGFAALAGARDARIIAQTQAQTAIRNRIIALEAAQ